MPGARLQLRHHSPMELLVSTILSAQCTDVRVNQVTPALFARYRTPADFAAAAVPELEDLIRPCGLFRAKARAIVSSARHLVERHGGKVPSSRALLEELPGVGHKTAGVVSMHLAGGDPALPVDTHVGRVSRRLGFTRETDPDLVERDLCELLPTSSWVKTHHLLIWHGRRTCSARSPACDRCPLAKRCPRIGVGG